MESKRKSAVVIPARHNASVRSRALGSIPDILESLGSLRADERRAALSETTRAFDDGMVLRPQETGWANMLARTFFSFSQEGFSPERLVWEAVIRGLSVAGSCDTDSLKALDGMQAAGDALGMRVTVSMETRAFAESAADREVNCPGSPGLVRVVGMGFTEQPAPDSDHGAFIQSLAECAKGRARKMVEKLNPMLSPVSLDFENDLVPRTPSGNVGIGHIAALVIEKAALAFPNSGDRAVFWGDVLSRSPQDVERLWSGNTLDDFVNAVREKLLRMAPDETPPAAYPPVAELFRAFEASGAAACVFWNAGGAGGASGGASDAGTFLDDAINWGARCVALEPDAAWNIADPAEKENSLARLAGFMAAAKKRNLPVLAGSFMECPGRKFVDSFDAPELSAYVRDFADAAFWLHGHATLRRAIGAGLTSEWAYRRFGADHAALNAFYAEAGRKAAPGKLARARIAGIGPDARPGDVLDALAAPAVYAL